MEPIKTPRKRRLVNASTHPVVRAFVRGQSVTMRTEKLGRSTLFLTSETYVPPRVVFELYVTTAPGEEALRLLASSSFVERTTAGYGIGVELSSLAAEDQKRWSQFLAKIPALAAATASSSARLRPVAPGGATALVVVAQALTPQTVQALQRAGVEIESVPSVDRAVERAQSGAVKMIVCDLQGTGPTGIELCEQLRHSRPAVRVMLLSRRDREADFDSGLAAGATTVIGKPCGQKLLVTRILDLYYSESNDELDSGARALAAGSVQARESAPDVALGQRRGVLRQLSSWALTGLLGARQLFGSAAS